MEIVETVNKPVEEVVDVICDGCGKSCKVFLDAEKTAFNFEYMKLNTLWGFGSNKDLQYWEAHICEKCVDEKLGFIQFKKENLPPPPPCPIKK